jgi:hypothetical protein
MKIHMIGLDTAKFTFQVHAVDETGQPVIRRKLQRKELIPFARNWRAARLSWKRAVQLITGAGC